VRPPAAGGADGVPGRGIGFLVGAPVRPNRRGQPGVTAFSSAYGTPFEDPTNGDTAARRNDHRHSSAAAAVDVGTLPFDPRIEIRP
jgi:hypothetical protein